MSAIDFLAEGDADGAREALENIHLGKRLSEMERDPFTEYIEAQKHWVEVIRAVKENRYELRKLMEANNLTQDSIERNEKHVRAVDVAKVAEEVSKHDIFEAYSNEEIMKVAKICKIMTFYENERVFSAGDINDSVNYILKGKVSLNIPGEETEVAVLEKGSLVGESCMVHKQFRTNCTAREFTEFLVVPLDKLVVLEKDDPVFATKFMRMIIGEMAKKISDSNNKVREILSMGRGEIDEAVY